VPQYPDIYKVRSSASLACKKGTCPTPSDVMSASNNAPNFIGGVVGCARNAWAKPDGCLNLTPNKQVQKGGEKGSPSLKLLDVAQSVP